MHKPIVLTIVLSTLISTAHIVLPVYKTVSPRIAVTHREFRFNSGYHSVDVHAKRLDIFQFNRWFVKIEADVVVNGTKISIRSSAYPQSELCEILEPSKADVYPQTIRKYWYDGVLFVRAPGDTYTWIKYDHPDNYDTYFPGQVNINYELRGDERIHHHISRAVLEDAKLKCSFARIAGLLGPIIAGLLLIPEFISKLAAAIIALVGAVCSFLGYMMTWFIENIIQTELKDGWVWTWGYCLWSWWFFTLGITFAISFGSLRDWPFFIYIPVINQWSHRFIPI